MTAAFMDQSYMDQPWLNGSGTIKHHFHSTRSGDGARNGTKATPASGKVVYVSRSGFREEEVHDFYRQAYSNGELSVGKACLVLPEVAFYATILGAKGAYSPWLYGLGEIEWIKRVRGSSSGVSSGYISDVARSDIEVHHMAYKNGLSDFLPKEFCYIEDGPGDPDTFQEKTGAAMEMFLSSGKTITVAGLSDLNDNFSGGSGQRLTSIFNYLLGNNKAMIPDVMCVQHNFMGSYAPNDDFMRSVRSPVVNYCFGGTPGNIPSLRGCLPDGKTGEEITSFVLQQHAQWYGNGTTVVWPLHTLEDGNQLKAQYLGGEAFLSTFWENAKQRGLIRDPNYDYRKYWEYHMHFDERTHTLELGWRCIDAHILNTYEGVERVQKDRIVVPQIARKFGPGMDIKGIFKDAGYGEVEFFGPYDNVPHRIVVAGKYTGPNVLYV